MFKRLPGMCEALHSISRTEEGEEEEEKEM